MLRSELSLCSGCFVFFLIPSHSAITTIPKKKFLNVCAYDSHFCSLKPLNSNFGMQVCNDFHIIIIIVNTSFLKSEYDSLNFF